MIVMFQQILDSAGERREEIGERREEKKSTLKGGRDKQFAPSLSLSLSLMIRSYVRKENSKHQMKRLISQTWCALSGCLTCQQRLNGFLAIS